MGAALVLLAVVVLIVAPAVVLWRRASRGPEVEAPWPATGVGGHTDGERAKAEAGLDSFRIQGGMDL